MATTNDIYTQQKNHQLSILENPFVISKIRECLSTVSGIDTFNDVFEDIRKYTELARSEGVLALSKHKVANEIINEFVELLIGSVMDYASVQQEKGVYIDFEYIEWSVFIIMPKILYSDLAPIDFVKTVLLYESLIMSITGFNSTWIERRLNGIIRK